MLNHSLALLQSRLKNEWKALILPLQFKLILVAVVFWLFRLAENSTNIGCKEIL